ncbi:Putative epoxide hydrolase [Cladobotryum mycophilum]|uniref:Epoxide hydrolase n=1 Tax=Cladobotryum mycophilum TaxID=491253 RepID=A0ABR0S9G1_9HYPO
MPAASEFATLPEGVKVTPRPFKISVVEDKLQSLKVLVQHGHIAPPTYENSQEDGKFGVSRSWIIKARDYWLNTFDWRAIEARLNGFPHFVSPIKDDDGKVYDIHFVALFSKRKDAVPLLALHGWPGSFLEFLPTLTLLTEKYTPDDLPYHVIVPSLPGYAFSTGAPLDKDFGQTDIARLMNALMLSLGLTSYVVQGGDVGSRVARILAPAYSSCIGIHQNIIRPNPPTDGAGVIEDYEAEGLQRAQAFGTTGMAYAFEQATRPSTIGLALQSSPLALLPWIAEKFLQWSDEPHPSMEAIVESVSLYWLTDTYARCIYMYREYLPTDTAHDSNPEQYIRGKAFGYSLFPKELASFPRSWIETTGDLVYYKRHDGGGHFAALERPKEFLEDMEEFIALAKEMANK